MDADLIQRLGERCSGPIRYGVDDCLHLAADVLCERTGIDILDGLRPGPISPDEAADIMDAHRGLVRFLLVRMRGFDRVPTEDGQVGLANVRGVMAACFPVGGGWWAARLDAGLTMFRGEHVGRAWRCHKQQ